MSDSREGLQKLGALSPARIAETETVQRLPLIEMIRGVICEFEALPSERSETDYPDLIAYALNREQRNIVMIRKRRPLASLRGKSPMHFSDGYFAEVYDLDETGKATNGFHDPSSLSGLYERIDITDDPNDPYDGEANLTPTKFDYTFRMYKYSEILSVPKALPSPGETPMGVLGQLFAHEAVEDQHRTMATKTDKDNNF